MTGLKYTRKILKTKLKFQFVQTDFKKPTLF